MIATLFAGYECVMSDETPPAPRPRPPARLKRPRAVRPQSDQMGAVEHRLVLQLLDDYRPVVKFARHVAGRHVTACLMAGYTEEEVEAATLDGLCRAAMKLNPAVSRFSTYAAWWVKGRLSDLLRRHPAVRPAKAGVRVVADDGTFPGDTPWLETFAGRAADPADAAGAAERAARVRAAVAALPARLRRVLTLRFGLDGRGERSLAQVGADLGVTKERSRQLIVRATAGLAALLGGDE